ncbi:MAG: Rrf2 family transcriptional regulator [Candidatus Staskawiczbacteria bacterium]|nr:Rrf2 family transcriptional regulator [Candidatus Staskawiczbacteria bacterium]
MQTELVCILKNAKMLKVSKKSQYGLRAAVFLAKNRRKENKYSVKTISEKEGIPFEFLEKIIRRMAGAGLVKAKKGADGGYFLLKPPAKISVEEIIFALEGKNPIVDCLVCGRAEKCGAKNAWVKIENSLAKTLKSIKLAELI